MESYKNGPLYNFANVVKRFADIVQEPPEHIPPALKTCSVSNVASDMATQFLMAVTEFNMFDDKIRF